MTSYEISTDRNRIDTEFVARFLRDQSYWAAGIPERVVRRSIENSLCCGAYRAGEQVGFARVITDYATFAYIADVFVVEAHRGAGVGQQIMAAILAHADLERVDRDVYNREATHG